MMELHNRTVTIFGGNGFIGRYIVSRLARAGALIRIASRHPDHASFLKLSGSVGQIVPIVTDINNDALVSAAVTDSDLVINLIGILYEKGSWTFDKVHSEGPRRIAGACLAAGVKEVIHVSSIGADTESESAYARSKGQGELALKEIFPSVRIVRPSIIFGAEDRFFNFFAGLALISPVLPLFGGGKMHFQPVYVGDVADAVMAMITSPETAGKTYELGGPQVYSFRELMCLMLKEIHRKRLLVSVPWWLARIQASVFERLPWPLLTRDQVKLLQSDSIVSPEALSFSDLGISPTALELILPMYLDRFRPGGRFGSRWRSGSARGS